MRKNILLILNRGGNNITDVGIEKFTTHLVTYYKLESLILSIANRVIGVK